MVLDIAVEQPAWKQFQGRARTILKAIREPSEGMLDAGGDAQDFDDSLSENAEAFNRHNVRYVWQAMIDAALETP